MDIKIVNLNKNKVLKVNKLSKEEQDKYFNDFLYQALGLKIVKRDLVLDKKINDSIDFLCVDESYRLVIVEKRYGKDTRLIKSGLLYIDYIREHISKLKMMLNDALGIEVAKNICYNPRLVLLTESFMQYDYKAIENLPYNIEVINFSFLDNDLVFVKTYQNMPVEIDNNLRNNKVVDELIMDFLNLGEDISIWSNQNVITIRKIKALSYIIINNNEVIVIINNKQYIVKDSKDLKKLESKIEKAYDEN